MGVYCRKLEAGVHRTYLGAIERGIRNPTLKNITLIARALGVSLSELFDYDQGDAFGPKPA